MKEGIYLVVLKGKARPFSVEADKIIEPSDSGEFEYRFELKGETVARFPSAEVQGWRRTEKPDLSKL